MHLTRFRTATLAAGLLALAAVAPVAPVAAQDAQTPGTADAPRVVHLDIGDGAITPNVVDVLAGETITFEATNVSTGGEVELIVGLKTDVDADSGDSLKEAEGIQPGATDSVTYTFDGEGPWGFGDQVGDHYAAGAKGDIAFVDSLDAAASTAP
jgi:plastocyanin